MGENGDKISEQESERKINEEISKLNHKVEILTARGKRFEKKVIDGYKELMEKINNDPRFVKLHSSD